MQRRNYVFELEATDVPVIKLSLTEAYSVVVYKVDIDAISKAIACQTAGGYKSPEMARLLSKHAQKTWSMSNVTEQHFDLYRQSIYT